MMMMWLKWFLLFVLPQFAAANCTFVVLMKWINKNDCQSQSGDLYSSIGHVNRWKMNDRIDERFMWNYQAESRSSYSFSGSSGTEWVNRVQVRSKREWIENKNKEHPNCVCLKCQRTDKYHKIHHQRAHLSLIDRYMATQSTVSPCAILWMGDKNHIAKWKKRKKNTKTYLGPQTNNERWACQQQRIIRRNQYWSPVRLKCFL